MSDLCSSALADILSEPTLAPPVTVGLYARWGSGKSFILKKLQGKESQYNEAMHVPHEKGLDPILTRCVPGVLVAHVFVHKDTVVFFTARFTV